MLRNVIVALDDSGDERAIVLMSGLAPPMVVPRLHARHILPMSVTEHREPGGMENAGRMLLRSGANFATATVVWHWHYCIGNHDESRPR